MEKTPLPPFPTRHGQYSLGDARAQFARLTKQTPRDAEGELAFVASKLHMLRTQPGLSKWVRESLLKELASHFSLLKKKSVVKSAVIATPPVPGGVGYGMFYNDPFKTDFATGSGIYWEIICPQPPGGNITTYFYLTATNRAAKGVEAFISYNGQSSTFFKVFDWARSDHWQTNIAFADLGDYLQNVSAHGNSYQVLPVLNYTVQRAPNDWYNQVWLYAHAANRWDLIYEYSYPATLAEQQTGFVGSWGPIVETFQPSYTGTSPMGAATTQLVSCNPSGVWGDWHLLNGSDSWIRDDHKGFNLLFLDPNYEWAVNS